MEFIEDFITDESVICFKDGVKVTGTKAVSDFALKCCEEYNAGYMEGMKKAIVSGTIIGGLVMGATIIVTRKIINRKKKTQK